MDKYIERLTKAIEEGIEKAAEKTADLLEKENEKLAPKDTGSLKSNIDVKMDNDYMAEVRAKSPYAQYVIRGTGIYNTEGARKKGWYYIVSNPKSKYYGWHYTEGQEPNNFPEQAYENKKNEISKIIDSEIDKAISKL